MTESDERVAPAVLDLTLAAQSLDKASADFDSLTVEESVANLSTLKEVIGNLRQLEAALERWVAECFKAEGWRDPQEFPGVGSVEVRRSKNRRAWDHLLARSDWLNRYLDRHEGEIPDAFEFIEDFCKAAQINGWKIGGFRALDLDVDDYCSSEPGTPTVQIVRAS